MQRSLVHTSNLWIYAEFYMYLIPLQKNNEYIELFTILVANATHADTFAKKKNRKKILK